MRSKGLNLRAREESGMAVIIGRNFARDVGENFPQKTSRFFDSPPISIE